jgi:hypothetical protein
MNRWQFLYNLRARLIFLVLLALLPALAIMLYTADETRQQEVVRTRENIHTLTQLVASREVQLIEGARQFLITLAQLQEVREADLAACRTRLADLLIQYPSYRFLGVANLEGEVTCSTASSTEPVNVAVRPWFQQALESRNFAVGDYQVGRTSGAGILIFGYPVLDEANQPQAVVFAVREVTSAWPRKSYSLIRPPALACRLCASGSSPWAAAWR